MKITLTRAEGPSYQCGKPETADTFARANQILWRWSTTAPREGYDKCDFLIEDAEADFRYQGRYDLQNFTVQAPDLQKHCVGFLRFMGGAAKPLSMREEAYQAYIRRATPDDAERADHLKVADWLEQQP
jgi:hypothetical protein